MGIKFTGAFRRLTSFKNLNVVPPQSQPANLLYSFSAQTVEEPVTIVTADRFGVSIAFNAAGDNLLVGAPINNSDAVQAGVVFSLTELAGTWSEDQSLVPADVSAADNFGTSVAVNEAGTVFAAGSPNKILRVDSTNYMSSGAVYIFNKAGGNWVEAYKITLSAPVVGGPRLGSSLAISSDGLTVAAGAAGDDGDNSNAGAVYVFELQGGSYVQTARLANPLAAANDSMGQDQGCMDFNAAGTLLAVGIPFTDNGGSATGSVVVFEKVGGNWALQTVVDKDDLPELGGTDTFGRQVRLSPDGNQMFVSSRQDDDGAGNAGAVYVLERSGGNWNKVAKLTGSVADDAFGHGLDLSWDGFVLAVGIPGHDIPGTTAVGRVAIYTKRNGIWQFESEILNETPAVSDNFGRGVTLDGDGSRLAVNTRLESTAEVYETQ